jgi:hypothetical protein
VPLVEDRGDRTAKASIAPQSDFLMNKLMKMWLPRNSNIYLTVMAAFFSIVPTASFGKPVIPRSARPEAGITHVYLLRGLFNIFSTGMDEIRDKLEQRGIRATVDNHIVWKVLADEAVEDYKSGRIRTIVIIGHSAGAINAVDMANRIGRAGVPVSLVVTIDPSSAASIESSNVRRVANLYIPAGLGDKVFKGKKYSGLVENVNLNNKPFNHMTIDKSDFVQYLTIDYTLKVMKTDRQSTVGKISAAPV